MSTNDPILFVTVGVVELLFWPCSQHAVRNPVLTHAAMHHHTFCGMSVMTEMRYSHYDLLSTLGGALFPWYFVNETRAKGDTGEKALVLD